MSLDRDHRCIWIENWRRGQHSSRDHGVPNFLLFFNSRCRTWNQFYDIVTDYCDLQGQEIVLVMLCEDIVPPDERMNDPPSGNLVDVFRVGKKIDLSDLSDYITEEEANQKHAIKMEMEPLLWRPPQYRLDETRVRRYKLRPS